MCKTSSLKRMGKMLASGTGGMRSVCNTEGKRHDINMALCMLPMFPTGYVLTILKLPPLYAGTEQLGKWTAGAGNQASH